MNSSFDRIKQVLAKDKMFDINKTTNIIVQETLRALSPLMEISRCNTKIEEVKEGGFMVTLFLKVKNIYA